MEDIHRSGGWHIFYVKMSCVVYVPSVKPIVFLYVLCNVKNKLSFESNNNLDVLSKEKEQNIIVWVGDTFLTTFCVQTDL